MRVGQRYDSLNVSKRNEGNSSNAAVIKVHAADKMVTIIRGIIDILRLRRLMDSWRNNQSPGVTHVSKSLKMDDAARLRKSFGGTMESLKPVDAAAALKVAMDELHEIKHKTLVNMVEEVTVKYQGEKMQKRLLYMTYEQVSDRIGAIIIRMQASSITSSSVEKLLGDMGIEDIDLVINLLDATHGSTYYERMKETGYYDYTYGVSEEGK